MAEPFIAEIRVVPYNFAPRGWAFCNGQLLPIAQHTALFSLVGTMYGGDGRTTLGLPNLPGRAVMAPGRGPGLSDYSIGQSSGLDAVALTAQQSGAHAHVVAAAPDPAEVQAPSTSRSLARSGPGFAYQSDTTGNLVEMAPEALTPLTGGTSPHDNRSPLQVLNFVIALEGVYPSRS
ncbi:phage tail protein [Nocardioides sp.]|uniref:phage tail protein n=1 Tax=Nocardioides sp. TaxID=35761 RepID=UPI0035664C23